MQPPLGLSLATTEFSFIPHCFYFFVEIMEVLKKVEFSAQFADVDEAIPVKVITEALENQEVMKNANFNIQIL